MRISFVLGHELPFPPKRGGGVNSLLDSLTRELVRQGCSVTAYSPSSKELPSEDVIDGVKHVRLPGAERRASNFRNVVAGFPYAFRVRRALKSCDVLTCHMWQGFIFTSNPRAKVLTHTIHRDPKKFLLFFSGFDRIYSGSDAVTEQAARVVPSLSAKMSTIYNCVDFREYCTPFQRIPDNKIRFLYIGRISADKGLESFIRGFCRAAAINSNIYLQTVGPKTQEGGGDPDLLIKLENLVKLQGCEGQVEFSDPVFNRDQLDYVIKGCDVVVLPSIRGETLNMGILETMRYGRALLISDLPANRPLIMPGVTGLIGRAGYERDWAERILEMASDQDRLVRFGYAAYNFGKKWFSTENVAAEYVRDFESLLIKGAR